MQNSNNVLKTSVLVIGQSGVGKSSLLNYMFGKEVEKTGTGKAVTKEGIFCHPFKYDENFIINIYDTWGLEPGKNDEWEKIITDSIKKQDQKDISEWFNTVIFCISANSDRIQDFELKIIQKLTELKCNVIVVITNCQNEVYEPANKLKNQLKGVVISKNIIFVNSVSKKLIGSTTGTPTFGREKVFKAIIGNLWYTFRNKVPEKIKVDLTNREKIWWAEEQKKIDRFKFPVIRKNHTIDEYVIEINNDFDAYLGKEVYLVNQEFKDAVEYYSTLSKKFVSLSMIDYKKYKSDPKLEVSVRKAFSERVDNSINKMLSGRKKIVELVNTEIANGVTFKKILRTTGIEMGMYLSNSKKLKHDLKDITLTSLGSFNQSMMNEIGSFQKRIENLNIEKVFIDELK